MEYDVFGMCNPLYDIQAEVPDELPAQLGLTKGAMALMDEEQQRHVVSAIFQHIVNSEAGGSGANTMIALAMLGGSACYTGKLADDEHGKLYSQGLRDRGVTLHTPPGTGTTGVSVILITPDAERTMCTHLGICRELSPGDVNIEALRRSRYLYVTGYLWDTDTQKAAVMHAMHTAREAGVKVCLSLSDPFCVGRHTQDLRRIVHEHVDVVMGNDEEAQMLVGAGSASEAAEALTPYCDLVVITQGAAGSLLAEGGEPLFFPAIPVDAVDTTGAGDAYAAGILYGLSRGLPLERTGAIASWAAAEVVRKLGPRLAAVDAAQLRSLENL